VRVSQAAERGSAVQWQWQCGGSAVAMAMAMAVAIRASQMSGEHLRAQTCKLVSSVSCVQRPAFRCIRGLPWPLSPLRYLGGTLLSPPLHYLGQHTMAGYDGDDDDDDGDGDDDDDDYDYDYDDDNDDDDDDGPAANPCHCYITVRGHA